MGFSIDLAVDTSALVAILQGEPGAGPLLDALTAASRVGLSAANRTELLVVIRARLGEAGAERARWFLGMQQIRTIAVDEALADAAAAAYGRFGKGLHPAGLNFGDCFSYALAMREGVPLLFNGNDFSKTDVDVRTAPLGRTCR